MNQTGRKKKERKKEKVATKHDPRKTKLTTHYFINEVHFNVQNAVWGKLNSGGWSISSSSSSNSCSSSLSYNDGLLCSGSIRGGDNSLNNSSIKGYLRNWWYILINLRSTFSRLAILSEKIYPWQRGTWGTLRSLLVFSVWFDIRILLILLP